MEFGQVGWILQVAFYNDLETVAIPAAITVALLNLLIRHPLELEVWEELGLGPLVEIIGLVVMDKGILLLLITQGAQSRTIRLRGLHRDMAHHR